MTRHPNLWVVLTLREDYIAGLEPYSHLVPNRLRARFYMQHMGIESAREAVERPAANSNRPFAEGVAGMLVDNLRMVRTAGQTEYHTGEYVEPVQLQVVCFQLWEDLRSREGATIDLADLERLAGGGNLAEYVDRALSDFYEKAIARVMEAPDTRVTEQELRNWFSSKLITEAGTRSIVFRNEATGKTEGILNGAVDLLIAQFLLRTELRAGGAWVELVHDRFIVPIREANQAWLTRNLNPLTQDAQAWREASKPESMLYTGSQLAAAVAELQAKPADFGDLEQKFVEAGREAQRRLAARRQRTFNGLLLGFVLMFAALFVWSALSFLHAQRAQSSAEAAGSTAVAASARAVADAATARSAQSTSEVVMMTSVANTSNMATALANAQTSSATVVLTRGITSVPTTTPMPGNAIAIPAIITLTPFSPGCVDLLQNGGFETGWSPWIVPNSPIMSQIVTTPVFSGAYALQLGSQTQGINSYSSASQWVAIPWSRPRVTLQFWANTWAQSLTGLTGNDRQQVVLFAPGDTIMAVPWSVLENTQTWLPYSLDLIDVAGQTFAVYFNVTNDGTGGSTAMFVDDARLWACSAGSLPPPMAAASLAAPTPWANITRVAMAPVTESSLTVVGSVANVTRVAIAPPTQMFVGTPVVPPAVAHQLAQSSSLSRIRLQEVIRWFLSASTLVGIFLLLLWLLRQLFRNPNP